jgi:hypothetical protein
MSRVEFRNRGEAMWSVLWTVLCQGLRGPGVWPDLPIQLQAFMPTGWSPEPSAGPGARAAEASATGVQP